MSKYTLLFAALFLTAAISPVYAADTQTDNTPQQKQHL